MTTNFKVAKDVWLAHPVSGGNYGNGKGTILLVGLVGGSPNVQSRALLAIPYDMRGAFGVNAADLWLYSANSGAGSRGSSPAFLVEEVTGITGITEGTENSIAGYSTNGGGEVWPGPGSPTTTNRGAYNPGSDPGVGWIHVSLKAMLAARLASAPLGTIYLRLIAGTTGGYDENNAARTILFASIQNSVTNQRPYLAIDLTFNHPPTAPTITPRGQVGTSNPTLVPSTDGKSVTIDWTQNDADGADVTAATQYQFFADAVTQATVGAATPLKDITIAQPNKRSGSDTITGLTARTIQKVRARSKDNHNTWGGWSSVDDAKARIQTAYLLLAPSNPYFQAQIPAAGAQPLIAGSISSSDLADFITQYEVEVYQDQVGGGTITMWAPGPQNIGGSPTRAQLTYAGQQVNPGDTVRWHHRIYNRDGAIGPWSPFMSVTFTATTGPTGMSPIDRNTKILSPLGPLTLGNVVNFDRYEVWLKRNGAVVWDSGGVTVATTASVSVVIPAGILNFGDGLATGLTWAAAVRPTGNSAFDPTSPDMPLQIDTLPTTIVSLPEAALVNGKLIVATRNPLITSPYIDYDAQAFNEPASAREFEVRAANAIQGAGALVLKRTSVNQIDYNSRTGEQIDRLIATAGWTPDANAAVAAYTATAPTGYATSTSLEVQATGGTSASRGAARAYVKDLSAYGGGAMFRIQRRITSVTNLNWCVLTFYFATVTDYANFKIALPTDAINTWAEVLIAKGSPYATGGTVDWSNVTAIGIRLVPGAAYTGNLEVRDLRLGLAQTDKTVPDGDLAWESSYDIRVRYHDTATPKLSTTIAATSAAAATNIRMTSVTGSPALAVGDWLTIETAGLVESRQITAIGTAGAGGTGFTVSEGFTYAHTSADVAKVYYWGPWSSWITVKVSQPPAVAASSPADGATITDPTLDLVHTFTSPAAKAQANRETRIYLRVGGVDQLVRTIDVAGAGLTDTLPRLLLYAIGGAAATFAWETDAYDSDGLIGTTTRRTFTTNFTAPAILTTLVAVADDPSGLITLTWDASVDALFDHYRVYWRDASGNYVRIDSGPAALDDGLTPLTVNTFAWYGNRSGTNEFVVTQHNGALESDYALVNVDQGPVDPTSGTWSAVRDGEDRYTFGFRVFAAPRDRDATIDTLRPLGRGTAVHNTWGLDGRHESLTVRYRAFVDGDLVTVFEELLASGDAIWLRAPAGYQWDPLWCVVVGLQDAPEAGGGGWLAMRVDVDQEQR